MLLLPSELKSLIAELLVSSPNSLAALARTHSTYQREAEKALYNTLQVSIFTTPDNSLKCMETLATNPEKAALVHFLTFQYSQYNIDSDENRTVTLATTYLSKSLINMCSLSDFRIRSFPIEVGDTEVESQMIKCLGKILCEGHFRLQTLYCHDVLNIPQIIESQTELQILGLYTGNSIKIFMTLKELHNAQLFLPIVFTLEHESFRPVPGHISIFPAFYSVDRCDIIPQALAQSICKDQANHMLGKANDVHELSIYLIDSSDIPSISSLAKDMAVNFPQISCLNFCFERRREIPPHEIQELFSFFSKLHEVCTYVCSTGTA